MRVSALLTPSIAMSRAASTMPSWWSRTNLRYAPWDCCTGGSAQNRAASVWSAERTEAEAVLDPIVFVSLYACVHWALPRAGGPAGRNCIGDWRVNGRIRPRYVPSGGVGAVGSQTPGIGGFGGVYVTGA